MVDVAKLLIFTAYKNKLFKKILISINFFNNGSFLLFPVCTIITTKHNALILKNVWH
tara:strand:- start:18090 stop:18260 length:171 start_codon:yes stop_codon:yes gene_type:complete